jgi:hypothetical protein
VLLTSYAHLLSSNGSFCPETDDSTWSDLYIVIFHRQFSDVYVLMGGPNNSESYHHVFHIIAVRLRSSHVGTRFKAKPP